MSKQSWVEGKSVEEKDAQPTERTAALRIVKQNRFKNLGELHKEWTEAGVKSSRATTHRRVKEFDYSCHPRCLTWAKEKKIWTVAQWSKVLFSDENKFCISFGNQGPRVWRKGGKAHSPSCLKSSVKFPQSVMIWGVMSSAGVGPLFFFENQRHCKQWLPTVCSLCVCLLLCVYTFGWDKCRALIPSMGYHTLPHVTSPSIENWRPFHKCILQGPFPQIFVSLSACRLAVPFYKVCHSEKQTDCQVFSIGKHHINHSLSIFRVWA